MAVAVRDNEARHRYEVFDDGVLAGFLDYKRTGSQLALIHEEVSPAFQGRGLAGALAAHALDEARRSGDTVIPFCPYVRAYIAAHRADYLDLVPEDRRDDFDLGEVDERG